MLSLPVDEALTRPVGPQVWSVAALVHAVADTLACRYSVVSLRGELSGFSRAPSGHCYLSLKDADGGNALIRCAMFRRAAALLDFSAADGQLVDVRGRLTVYEPRGELQFVIESMQRAGAGALFEQFLRLRAKLEAQGLFDAARKRPLPAHPRRVGIVTSLGAAALHDVLSALARRAPHVAIVVYPSLVQGADAPATLVAALELAQRRAEVDALMLCRGGGSLEDLWAFNDERVVRAIAHCALPLVSGVGHETDLTLADLAADVRAPTPTAAAELVSPTQASCLDVLAHHGLAMSRRVHQLLDAHAQRLDRAALRLRRPADSLRRHSQHLDLLQHRLKGSVQRTSSRLSLSLQASAARLRLAAQVHRQTKAQRIVHIAQRLQGLDPRRVLARGYAWLINDVGHPVLSTAQLVPGQPVTAVLGDGRVQAQVTEIIPSGSDPDTWAGS